MRERCVMRRHRVRQRDQLLRKRTARKTHQRYHGPRMSLLHLLMIRFGHLRMSGECLCE
jgi:hypothetical protein